MAIVLASQADDSDGTAAVTATAGDLIVVAWAIRNTADFTGCAGSLNGSYTQAAAPQVVSGIQCGIHFFQNSAAGAETVTVSNTGGGTIYINVSRWTGAHTTAALVAGQSTTTAAATTHPHSATGVNATAGQLMVTVAVQSATITDETVATGFTALSLATATNGRQWWQYRIATGTESSQVAAYTSSSHTSAGMIALFDQAAAGGSLINPFAGKLGFPLTGKL